MIKCKFYSNLVCQSCNESALGPGCPLPCVPSPLGMAPGTRQPCYGIRWISGTENVRMDGPRCPNHIGLASFTQLTVASLLVYFFFNLMCVLGFLDVALVCRSASFISQACGVPFKVCSLDRLQIPHDPKKVITKDE